MYRQESPVSQKVSCSAAQINDNIKDHTLNFVNTVQNRVSLLAPQRSSRMILDTAIDTAIR